MLHFKKDKDINLSYYHQGLVFFLMKNIRIIPIELQRLALGNAIDTSELSYQVVMDYLTDRQLNKKAFCKKYKIDPEWLTGKVNDFYHGFLRDIYSRSR